MPPRTISSTSYYRDDAALTIIAHITETSHSHTSKLSDLTIRISGLEDEKLTTTSDVTFNKITASSDVTINGDLTVNGGSTSIYSTTKVITDPLIELANGNNANNYDIGFYGTYYYGSTKYHTGLVWDASAGSYKLFRDLNTEPTNNAFTFTNTNYTLATLEAQITDITNHTISSLDDVDTTTHSPNTGQVLVWDGTNWTPGNQTTEVNNLTTSVTWTDVPDTNITQGSVTQHQAALAITESQITNLQNYLTSSSLPTGSSGGVIISNGAGAIDSTDRLNVNPTSGDITGTFVNVSSTTIKLGAGSLAATDAVGIGRQAGNAASINSVSIGGGAGISAGESSVSLGFVAIANDDNCIVINASGASLQSTVGSSCKIDPIRDVNAIGLTSPEPFVIQYNDSTKELFKSVDLRVRDIKNRNIQNDGTLTNVSTASLYNGQLTVGVTANKIIAGSNVLVINYALHKVGIKTATPTTELEVVGEARISNNGTQVLSFYDTTHNHEHGTVEAHQAGQGGRMEFHVKSTGSSALTSRLNINPTGSIAFASSVDYGSINQVLTSNGDAPPSWATLPTSLSPNDTVTFNGLTVGDAAGTASNTSIININHTINTNASAAIAQVSGVLQGNAGGQFLVKTATASGTLTERLRISNTGGYSFGGNIPNYGGIGQVLTAPGNGGPPVWAALPTIDISIQNGSNNSVTNNAIFDALALKSNLLNPTFSGTVQFGSTAKITINSEGAIGFGSNAQFGVTGTVLLSRAETLTPAWGVLPYASLSGRPTAGTNMTLVENVFNIPQSVATTASPTFNGLTVSTIDITNSLTLNQQTGTAGQVLTSQQAAAPIWTTLPTIDAIIQDGSANPVAGNAIFDALVLKANLSGPTFTGTVRVNGALNVGTGVGPGFTVDTVGHVRLKNSSGTPTTEWDPSNGNIVVTTLWYTAQSNYSDDRIKSQTIPLANATETIMKLNPVQYKKHPSLIVPIGKEDTDLTNVEHFTESGFVAQELEAIPELSYMVEEVKYNKDKLKGIKNTDLIAYLVKGLQEMNERIKILESK